MKLLGRVCLVAVGIIFVFVVFAGRCSRDGTVLLCWQSGNGLVHAGGGRVCLDAGERLVVLLVVSVL